MPFTPGPKSLRHWAIGRTPDEFWSDDTNTTAPCLTGSGPVDLKGHRILGGLSAEGTGCLVFEPRVDTAFVESMLTG